MGAVVVVESLWVFEHQTRASINQVFQARGLAIANRQPVCLFYQVPTTVQPLRPLVPGTPHTHTAW